MYLIFTQEEKKNMKNRKDNILRTLYYPAIFLKLKKTDMKIFLDFENSATCGRNLVDGMYLKNNSKIAINKNLLTFL